MGMARNTHGRDSVFVGRLKEKPLRRSIHGIEDSIEINIKEI
jgi:hypothetical protein